MKLHGPWITPTTVTNSKGETSEVFDVRWRIVLDNATERSPRKRCASKSAAEAHKALVERAVEGQDGWMIDGSGKPVRPAYSTNPDSLLTAVREFALATFPALRPATRTKNESVLIRVIAAGLTGSDRFDFLAVANARRELAPSPIVLAVRYLREVALVARTSIEPTPEHLEGRRWLADRLPVVADLDERYFAAIWELLVAGRPYSTSRSYLSVVKKWVTWMIRTKRFASDPLQEMERRRDLTAERVDVRRVPDAAQVECIAEHLASQHSEDESFLIRLSAAAALRISEALGLQRRHLVQRNGRWYLPLDTQRHATVKRQSWDVGDRQVRKEAHDETSVVDIPLPASMSGHIAAALERIGPDADEPLCRGPRGGPLCEDTLRVHWNKTIAELFPVDHRLAGITPHSLRHHAMTTWLRSGIDMKRCQEWGRWAKLSVMLDVYAGVFEADDDEALARLDSAAYAGDAPDDAAELPAASDVISLDEWRRRATGTSDHG